MTREKNIMRIWEYTKYKSLFFLFVVELFLVSVAMVALQINAKSFDYKECHERTLAMSIQRHRTCTSVFINTCSTLSLSNI